jgi:hypothetical protein
LKKLTKETLSALINQEARAPAVTIYLPTHRVSTPPHLHEDQVRFKNLMNKAINILEDQDTDESMVTFVRSKMDNLIGNQSFWENLTNGLLICMRPDSFDALLLPVDCDEYVSVDSHYHLAPVYGLVEDNLAYYVLSIAKHDPQLFVGDMYHLQDSGLELPESPEKALNIDELQQKQQHYHKDAGGFGTGQNAGRGTADTGAQTALNYFSLIDKMIHDHCDKALPLVLAGTEDSVSGFRQMSKYPHILETHVEGNYTKKKPEELFGEAWKVVSKELLQQRQQLVLDYQRIAGENPARASTDPVEIVEAAEQGRIERLLIAMSRFTKDTVRDQLESVPKIVFPGGNKNQIVDRAAQFTWGQSGKVYNLAQEDLPHNASLAAIFRY